MKIKSVGVLCGAMICGLLTTNAIANEVTLFNASPGHHPVTVIYKVAHKNPGGATVFSAPQTVELKHDEVISFDLNGYQLAGVVPVSVNGHELVASVNEFDNAKRCSLTTDAKHTSGILAIKYTAYPNGHGNLGCRVTGGLFD